MINKIKWYKGLSVKVSIDFEDDTKISVLTYIDDNKFISNRDGELYFNESLFPCAYEGLVMYISIDNPINQRQCEITELLD